MNYFFPSDFQDLAITPATGNKSLADAFQFRVTFFSFATLRLPYRSIAPAGAGWTNEHADGTAQGDAGAAAGVTDSARGGPGAVRGAWVSVALDAGSEVRASIPTLVRSRAGCAGHVLCDLVRPTIVSSISHAPMVSAERISVNVTMRYPVAWNSCHRWSLDVAVRRPDIFLFRQYITAFSDLATDWADCAEINLAEFIPTLYTYAVTCRDTTLFVNVNEDNVVSNANDLLLNEHVAISVPVMRTSVVAPLDEHKATSQSYEFTVTFSSGAPGLQRDAADSSSSAAAPTCVCSLLLPARHPWRRIFNANLALRDGRPRPRSGPVFMEFDKLEAKCTYLYHGNYTERGNDTFDISTEVTNLRFVRYTSAMKAMLSLHANLFGASTCVTSEAAYVAAGMKNMPSEYEDRRACIVCQNAFETHIMLVVNHCEVMMPTVVYPPLDENGRIIPYVDSLMHGKTARQRAAWQRKRRRGDWRNPHQKLRAEPPLSATGGGKGVGSGGGGAGGGPGGAAGAARRRDARKPFVLSFECDEVCAEIRSVTNATNSKSNGDVAIASTPIHIYAPQPYMDADEPDEGLPAAAEARVMAKTYVALQDGADGCIDGVHWHWHNSYSRAHGGLRVGAPHAPMLCYSTTEELHFGFIACAMNVARFKRSSEAISHAFVTKRREEEWYEEERTKMHDKFLPPSPGDDEGGGEKEDA